MTDEGLIKWMRRWHMAEMDAAADRTEQLFKEREATLALLGVAADNIRSLHRAGTAEASLAKAVEALHFYADFYEAPNDGPWGVNSDDFGTKARAMLAELEKTE